MVQTFSLTRPGSLASPIPTRPHPPPLSPAMIALSNSSHGRESGKRVGRREFEHPPTLPARADPSSEDARLVGPFSRRRLMNERWRFFKSQVGRLLPPLHIKTEPVVDHIERATALGRKYEHSLINPADILHAFLDDASRPRPANVPRKARRDIAADSACELIASTFKFKTFQLTVVGNPVGREVNYSHNDLLSANKPRKWTSRQSPRFFRRRHQEILRLLPIMTQTLHHSTVKDSDLNGTHGDPSQLQRKFSVSQSPLALKRRTDSRDISSPPISKEDRTWVEQAEKIKG